MKRVVITGLGAITPLGNTINEFWNNILEGKNGVGPITKFDASKFKTRFACEVKNFNPTITGIKKKCASTIFLRTMPLLHQSRPSGTPAWILKKWTWRKEPKLV